MTEQAYVDPSTVPFPNEDKVIEELRTQLRSMQDYLGDTPCWQRVVLQASKDGWYFQFRSDDYFTSYEASGLKCDLWDAMQASAEEATVPNPIGY